MYIPGFAKKRRFVTGITARRLSSAQDVRQSEALCSCATDPAIIRRQLSPALYRLLRRGDEVALSTFGAKSGRQLFSPALLPKTYAKSSPILINEFHICCLKRPPQL